MHWRHLGRMWPHQEAPPRKERAVSDFFCIHAPPEFSSKTLRQLAVMVHEAEETADDILLLQAWDELERRKTPRDIFMGFYRDEWHKRMA
jgi:hypothetical protein